MLQEVCQSVLSVLDIVYPGRTKYRCSTVQYSTVLHCKYRGLVLHELAEATLTLAAQLYSKEAISREQFAGDLARVSAWLEDGCRWVQGVCIISRVMYHCRCVQGVCIILQVSGA